MQSASIIVSRRTVTALSLAIALAAALFALAAPRASADISNPKLSGGVYSTCAIYPNNRVYCWGSNSSTQLGFGNTARTSMATRPYPVKGIPGTPVGVSAGYSNACAMLSGGSMSCWGKNKSGALGAKNKGGYARAAQSVAALISPWVSPSNVATGGQSMCFRDNNQTVKCQGDNSYGQLGTGNNTPSTTAVQVATITGASGATRATQVVAGASHNCALLVNDNVKCWGLNNYRQLGSPALSVGSSSTPVDVPNLANNITQLASMADHTCAIHQTDTITCWGANAYGQLGDGTVAPYKGAVAVDNLGGDARQVSTGVNHTCALISGGRVKCWGDNTYGQLGTGNTTASSKPVSVIGLTRPVSEITAGGYHSCARLDTGAIYCWGRGTKGQLGNATAENKLTPTAVDREGGIRFANVRLAKGSGHSTFYGTVVATPVRNGKLSTQCRTNAKLTVSVFQDGATVQRRLKQRLRPSGSTKCTARFSYRSITRSVGAATLTLSASYHGTDQMPGSSLSQTFTGQ